MEQPVNPTSWTASRKLLFRFFFAFFLLYIVLNPNAGVPKVDLLFDLYIQPFHHLIPWIGQHILHLSKPITVFTNGSGDTTYDYVTLLFLFVVAILASLGWSFLDRKRASYNVLLYWLTTIVRYYLAITMLSYGYSKVFKAQFPAPDVFRMMEPYGESSPMGLAWTFMGYSQGYNYFTGFAEVLAGLLLFFRRTTTIGALVALVVSANIMAMNYCFDIPVKLLSTMMVVMSLFLLSDNIRQLSGLFFGHRTVRLVVPRRPLIRKRALSITLIAAKFLLIAYVVAGYAFSAFDRMQRYGDDAPHTPLYGIYNTKVFLVGKDTLPGLPGDTTRWKQLVIGGSSNFSYAVLKMMNDSLKGFESKTDTTQRLLTISDYDDSTKRWLLHYRSQGKDSLILWGSREWGRRSDSILIALTRYPADYFPLARRKFSWINEYPYNR